MNLITEDFKKKKEKKRRHVISLNFAKLQNHREREREGGRGREKRKKKKEFSREKNEAFNTLKRICLFAPAARKRKTRRRRWFREAETD